MDKIAHEEEGWAVAGSEGKRKNRGKRKQKKNERRDLESVESVVSSTPEESSGSVKSSGTSSSNNASMESAAPSVEFNMTSSDGIQNSLFKPTKELFAPDETSLPNFAPRRGLYHVSIPMTHPDCKAITLNVGTPTSPNPVHGQRRPIRRRLINVPSVPAPLVEYDRESSPDGAGDMLEELREEQASYPLIITSLSLKGLADCGSLSRPRSAISSRARPRSGGYISQFAARRPNPRQTAPKHSTNDGRTGEGSAFRRLRPPTANSVRPKTTGHTDRIQSRSVGRLERWEAIIARIKAPPKAAQCAPLPEEANLSCRWVIGGDSVASAVAEDMDLTELDRHFGIIADDDGEELHAPD
ncbi:hypothetical protein FOZ60_002796 [Perkinsus olseni]|uniref:Uncharacterized protein n=1 Tax=Perkinsus olseni TaxID=32597 RepID=A0A7J6NY57_PEROL|nr:hypothetical protein FOZ60_002796 [Perkinsus olseni]